MKVTLVQSSLHWQDISSNLNHFEKLLDSDRTKTDLIVLPEMFNTGFTMQPEKYAEAAEGSSFQWMKKQAHTRECIITGSMAVSDGNSYFNRLYWVAPNGKFLFYDKRHLFRMGGEHEHYNYGTQKLITTFKDWRICPMVCYDLRFPVWSRNRFDKKNSSYEYDVLIYIANWPAARAMAWKQLLIARAIENQCYVIGVNRIGEDGNGVAHSGDSMVIDAKGDVLYASDADQEELFTILLDKRSLDDFRTKFPAGMDGDVFTLETK